MANESVVRKTWLDLVTLVAGIATVIAGLKLKIDSLITIGSGALLLATSTAVVTASLTLFTGIPSESTNETCRTSIWNIITGKRLQDSSGEDTGWLIGRLENVLIFVLVMSGEYTALSIIFAAKSWVRYEDTTSGDSTYYLAGTLVNFTYSVLFASVVTRLVG